MMPQSKRIYTGISGVVILLSLGYFVLKEPAMVPNLPVSTEPSVSESNTEVADLIDSPFNKDTEIVFSKSLAIQSNSISIDGGEFQQVPCSSNMPGIFGYITLKDNTKLELTCYNEYMGGISIVYVDASGKPESVNIAMKDGDAGDTWDRRTWITKIGDNVLFKNISLFSYEDEVDKTQLECKVTEELTSWKPDSHKFVVTTNDQALGSASDFTLPINVSEKCLDIEGHWIGK
jgi:hypothetical protein